MRPDIISVGQSDAVLQWVAAVERDIDAGLVPQWIGAIVLSVRPDGTAQMTLIERHRWIMAKLEQQIGLN